jgi:demethylmenaquinone methyltransferase/2-methoxy-6-polyprenyl-1,4-benzoquinol methylase
MTPPYTGPDAHRIREMFASISGRYDRANQVLSAGVHHLWRKQAVAWSDARPGDRVLDCATGTGDLAIAFAEAGCEVTGTDFVPEMLVHAREKAPKIHFETADVTALPFPDASFDIASISFGIRNVNDPRKGVSELSRVVKSGGRVMILEFGQPPNRLFRRLYDFYRIRILPRLGAAITGKRDAYEYLERSSAKFPCGDAFAQLMRDSGDFIDVQHRPLTLGIAYLYRAVKR